jgi:gluconokinase
MNIPNLRSCHDTVGGIVYFGRMLDKIRLHAQGKLPADYQANLGQGFDGRCCSFLRVSYDNLIARVKQGGIDDEILQWCFAEGRRPTDEEIEVWNHYMRKRGWRDDASKRLAERLKESGLSHRTDIQTFFDYIDADEGRELRT